MPRTTTATPPLVEVSWQFGARERISAVRFTVMRRLMILIPIAVAFAAGWTLASGRGTTAEAQAKRPKPVACKDDLAKAKRELAASQAETVKAKAQLAVLLEREHKRVEDLEERLSGEPIKDLK